MDVACLERVAADLSAVPNHPTARAFNAELEKVVGARTDRDLKEAQRCVEGGNIDCADQRLKLPLALRPNDAAVIELREQLEKSRSAVAAAESCLSGTQNECVAVALENLRQASPQSALIKKLEQRNQPEAPQPTGPATATDKPQAPLRPAPSQQPAPYVAPQVPAQPSPQPAPAAAPSTQLSVTAHTISMENQARVTDASGRTITQLTIQRSFGLSQPAAAQVQEVFAVLTANGQVLFRGSPNRTPELGNGNFGGRGTIPLPMALEVGQYEMKHQVLSGAAVLSERSLRFLSQGAPSQASPQSPPQQQADPAEALVRRLMAEGERCRIDKDCGCMKDKAVAVSSIDSSSQWANRMRQLASECARAKVEIK
jgi:hypothetical protein